MVVEIFLQNNGLTLQVFFIEKYRSGIIFQIYGGVLDFVVILQAENHIVCVPYRLG